MMFEASTLGSCKLDAAVALKQVSTIKPQYSVKEQPINIKNQMMRLLRRSKSTAAAQSEKPPIKTPQGQHHHYHHNHVVHPQHNRNSGGLVVNMVDGVPVVVGPGIGKNKKELNLEDR
ncbi:hypothetical protein HUJ05_004674 [Dendroctonus ponderosae]|nr:hypothetical protein HUJ05_004674 [Dendroctonus ponderosae]